MMTVSRANAVSKKFKVLLVDDHPIVRHGLRDLLTREPDIDVCGEAEDVSSALEVAEATCPDLVVADISLKNSNGFEFLSQFCARSRAASVLVWSMLDESLCAERAMRSGAAGYISKQEPVEVVLKAIRQVLRGEVYLSPGITNRILRATGAPAASSKRPIAALTNRELQVFELIGRGLTTQKIAHSLNLSGKTIEGYRENIKQKLHLENSSELLRCAALWHLDRAAPPASQGP